MSNTSFVVGVIDTAEYIELDRLGHRIFPLPNSIARHFIPLMTLEKGMSVVAVAANIDVKSVLDIKEIT